MSNNNLWSEISAFVPAFGSQYQGKAGEIMEKNGLAGVPGIFVLFNAHSVHPAGYDPAELHYRGPYGNPDALNNALQALIEQGWLTQADSLYHLTEKAQTAIQGMMDDFGHIFAQPLPADPADLNRLADLLSQLVSQAENATTPPGTTCLKGSRRLDRGAGAPVPARINRSLGDLNAFRDDCHLSAWQSVHSVSGPAWEAFSFVWNDQAHTAAKLTETLPFRQIDEAGYTTALNEAVSHGWLTEADGTYAITDTGQAIRQAAEDATNTHFANNTPLTEADTNELLTLLTSVGTALKPAEA